MRANYLVSQAVVEEPKDLLLCLALEVEEIFYGVNVKRIPLQLEASGISIALRTCVMKSRLLKLVSLALLEHGRIQQIINLLIVNLQEGHV